MIYGSKSGPALISPRCLADVSDFFKECPPQQPWRKLKAYHPGRLGREKERKRWLSLHCLWPKLFLQTTSDY